MMLLVSVDHMVTYKDWQKLLGGIKVSRCFSKLLIYH